MTAERRHSEKYGSEIRRTQHRPHRSDHRISGRDAKIVCNFQCRYQTHHTIPQVRHHWQPGRIDVDFLCSYSAAELSHGQPSGHRIKSQLPASFMGGVVMLRTQWNHVVEIGFSAVFPILDVMHIAHMKSPVASINCAGFIYRF